MPLSWLIQWASEAVSYTHLCFHQIDNPIFFLLNMLEQIHTIENQRRISECIIPVSYTHLEWVAEENPAQQVFRHRVLLQSIVGYQIPIIDVICLSHPSILIAGQENSRIPVIKKNLLADFIVNYRPAVLTSDHVALLEHQINNCKISKQ